MESFRRAAEAIVNVPDVRLRYGQTHTESLLLKFSYDCVAAQSDEMFKPGLHMEPESDLLSRDIVGKDT